MEQYRELHAEALAREHRDSETTALLHEAESMLDATRGAEAAALLQDAQRRGLDAPAVRLALGRALAAAGRHEEAAAQLASVPASPETHRLLAEIYGTLGRDADRARERSALQRLKEDRLRVLGGSR
jgi:predicted Zn-dependent protease